MVNLAENDSLKRSSERAIQPSAFALSSSRMVGACRYLKLFICHACTLTRNPEKSCCLLLPNDVIWSARGTSVIHYATDYIILARIDSLTWNAPLFQCVVFSRIQYLATLYILGTALFGRIDIVAVCGLCIRRFYFTKFYNNKNVYSDSNGKGMRNEFKGNGIFCGRSMRLKIFSIKSKWLRAHFKNWIILAAVSNVQTRQVFACFEQQKQTHKKGRRSSRIMWCVHWRDVNLIKFDLEKMYH